MASIDNVINVSLAAEGSSVLAENMNVCAVMTKQQTGVINTANRYAVYVDSASVATDFGSSSQIAAHAEAFFSTTPNPVNAGGLFIAGYWRGDEEITDATSAVMTGAELDEESTIAALQAIEDGAFNIKVDDAADNASALDFRVATDMDDVLSILNAAVTTATWTYVNNRIIITSDTTGATSLLDYATEPSSGTDVGSLLGIAAGTGASIVQGAASDTLAVETKVAAVTALKALVGFRGCVFIDAPSNEDKALLASWAQSNDVIMYDVFTGSDPLVVDVTNPAWAIKLASQKNYRCQHSKANNRRLATSYMASMHSVNFAVEKSAKTEHLKTLSVAAEEYNQTEMAAAQTIGLDLYTMFRKEPKLYTSGANDFTDNVYNMLSYIDAVKTALFNVLGTTPTKIPQTIDGVNALVDEIEKITGQYVRAGVFAPGTWSSSIYFGDYDTFVTNIADNGFYVLAGSLADQPQVDRVARKAPAISVAVKNAGAVHSADVVINFNL